MKLLSTAKFLIALLSSANALIPLEIKGNRFIKPAVDAKEAGEVFFIMGVDYQPGGSSDYSSSSNSDVLSDADACYRDAYVLQELGANTVRIYTVNPDVNHDKCMSILNDAGIYVMLDVNSPLGGESLNRADPASTYNSYYLSRVFKVIEAFKNYPNVIGFFSGNEIINDDASAKEDPRYIRALQRDMKQYIAAHADRSIPVGYSAANELDYRGATWQYLQCNIDGDEDDESKSDFFGLNTYEWCSGQSDWASSGYGTLNNTFQDSAIPLLFSEYGCIAVTPRTFDEVTEGLYSGLINTFSGGLVYEYSKESNNYGLVDIDSDGDLQFYTDYDNLKSQFEDVSLPSISEDDVADAEIIKCNAKTVKSYFSSFGANFTLPDQPSEIKDLIKNGVNATNVGKLVDVSEKYGGYEIELASGGDVATESAIATFSGYNTYNSQTGVTLSGTKASSSAAKSTATTSSSSSSSSSKAEGASAGGSAKSTGIMFALSLLLTSLL
ncbi:unnamed protein product [Kuraishia capsulata CBS 1993]|uniref:1,3-beta-glucanosyltransferase n=1 Tax=Kuraishia capsulata CBS 1993 TaxID=1382522 RepID=W6MSS8_9ASCO|nr:uncharacterized protein KUCA_T00005767001 [Kuraishia capsulata CBS 1993]CDK29774.1 unnamed protein product [Kuraishia capsulata CBS 1993]